MGRNNHFLKMIPSILGNRIITHINAPIKTGKLNMANIIARKLFTE